MMPGTDGKYAPVVVFVYNRADKIIKCLESLEKNPEAANSNLIIFSDGPKNSDETEAVENTRNVLHKYEKKSSFFNVRIVKAKINKGLAASIMEGVTAVLDEYGRAIILEDDLIVSDNFLSYMNGALDFYQDNYRIGAISAYTYPLNALKTYDKDIYIMHKGDCWGWATWKNRWDRASWSEVDYYNYFNDEKLRRGFENLECGWDVNMLLLSQGKINSWAIRWVLYLFKNNLWTIYPRNSLVTNNGFDGSGTHSNKSDESIFVRDITEVDGDITFDNLEPNDVIEREAAKYPVKGMFAGGMYRLKRLYVRLYDLKRICFKEN